LGTHGVAGGEGRARKDLEDDGQQGGVRAWWIEEACGKLGFRSPPFVEDGWDPPNPSRFRINPHAQFP
jgi:hypothetical protein